MPDVLTDNFGSIVGITPMTPTAREWIGENVDAEPWQWLGGTLNIDRRYADDLVEGMVEAGLTVGVSDQFKIKWRNRQRSFIVREGLSRYAGRRSAAAECNKSPSGRDLSHRQNTSTTSSPHDNLRPLRLFRLPQGMGPGRHPGPQDATRAWASVPGRQKAGLARTAGSR